MLLDIFLFSILLILNLAVGLGLGRGTKTLREYAINNKELNTGPIMATIIATHVGGIFMCYGLENTYTQGLHYIIPVLLVAGGLWLTAQIVGRMEPFLYNLSAAEVMGDLYGKNVRIITALSGSCTMVTLIAIQFKIITKILFLLLGLQGIWITCLAAGIMIAYSAFGGIQSITVTNAFQFMALGMGMSWIILAVYHSCPSKNPITTVLTTHPLFNGKQMLESIGWNPQGMHFLSLCFIALFPGVALAPHQFQKIAMSQSIQEAKEAFSSAALCSGLLLAAVLLLGLLLVAHNPTLNPKTLVDYIMTHYTSYSALQGLLATSIVASAMSMADSCLNTASVLWVNDIITPCKQKKDQERKQDLTLARICTFTIGTFALLLTFHVDNLFQFILLANSFMMPIYYIPFLLAIFGFRSTPTAVLISMATGAITVVLWRIFLAHTGIDSSIPGLLANTLAFLISHMLLPKPQGQPKGDRMPPQGATRPRANA